jgi:hypothetical protein
MAVLDEATLAEIKDLYQGNDLTLAEIGQRYGRTPSGISRLARTHGWMMRSVVRGWAPHRTLLSTPKVRAYLAHRLCRAIGIKLDQMEKDMADGKLSSQDFERDAQSVGSMIGGLEKVVATATDADKDPKPQSGRPPAQSAPASDVERIHREIIERFERIQRRRNAEAGPG